MNRFHFSAIAVFLVLVPASFASGEKTQGKADWPVVSIERTIPYKEGVEEPALSVSYSLPDFNGDTGIDKALRGSLYGGMTAKDYAEREISHDRAEYETALAEFDQDVVEQSATMNWEFSEEVSLVTKTPRLIVCDRMVSSYTGGAHGNYGSEYVALDVGDLSVLKISDVISRGAMPKLLALAEKKLREQYELDDGEPLSSAGFFDDALAETEDFAFTGDGFVLRWGLYAIAPYVMGEISVTIPYDDVSAILTPRARDLVESVKSTEGSAL